MAGQLLRAAGIRDAVGEVPTLATVESRDATANPGGVQLGTMRAARNRYGLNLPAVAEVLGSYGIDPVARLAEIVKQGSLSVQDEARLLAELTQYTRPKMKAVEVVVKREELTDEQVNQRLQRLLAVPQVRQEQASIAQVVDSTEESRQGSVPG